MASIVDLMDTDESDSMEVEMNETNQTPSLQQTDSKSSDPASSGLMRADQRPTNPNPEDASSDIPNLDAFRKGASIHEYKATYAVGHPDVVTPVPLLAMLQKLSKENKRLAPILDGMVNRCASTEQLTYFRAVLLDHLNLLYDQAKLTEGVNYLHITDLETEWAKPYIQNPRMLDPEAAPHKPPVSFDAAHNAAIDVILSAYFLADDQRRKLQYNLVIMSKRYHALAADLAALKNPPPPNPPPPKKPTRWTPPPSHPMTRKSLLRLVRNPQGDPNAPPAPAEAARPWMQPWFMHTPGALPEALFLLWDHRASTMATGHRRAHAHISGLGSSYVLLTEEARREALYTHCVRGARRHGSPFISVTASLRDIILTEQWRLKAEYLVEGTTPLLYLSVISPFARMHDGFPVLKFRDELGFYGVTHRAAEDSVRGAPAFENEWILPYAIHPSHIVGTWPLQPIQEQCRKDWYRAGKSEWASAFRGAKSKLGDLMAHPVVRKSEERWCKEYSIEPWFEWAVRPELEKCNERAMARTRKMGEEFRELEELGGLGVHWDRDGW